MMLQSEDKRRVIIALDYSDAEQARRFVEQLDPKACRVKIGKELFTRSGPVVVRELVDKGFDVFLDLKFHDIPSTVARACEAAADLGVWMINVHSSGGRPMMEAARQALANYSKRPLLIGVTVLTSMDQADLIEIGLTTKVSDQVERLARLTNDAGLDGVVCSSKEVAALRKIVSKEFCLVTPGIRPSGSQTDDQKRIMTPFGAIKEGADYLVIGRPITEADDPFNVLQNINAEINEALAG